MVAKYDWAGITRMASSMHKELALCMNDVGEQEMARKISNELQVTGDLDLGSEARRPQLLDDIKKLGVTRFNFDHMKASLSPSEVVDIMKYHQVFPACDRPIAALFRDEARINEIPNPVPVKDQQEVINFMKTRLLQKMLMALPKPERAHLKFRYIGPLAYAPAHPPGGRIHMGTYKSFCLAKTSITYVLYVLLINKVDFVRK